MTTVRAEFRIQTSVQQASIVPATINSDGEMSFPDPITDYEIAFAAMSGTKAPSQLLLEEWQADPITTLVSRQSSIPEHVKQELLIDAAESVTPILEKHSDPDTSESGRKIVKLCRIALASKRTEHYAQAYRDMKESMSHLLHEHEYGSEHRATDYIIDALYAACEIVGKNRITYLAVTRTAAAETNYSGDRSDDDKWVRDYRTQELWEIQRFVELMAKHVPESVVTP